MFANHDFCEFSQEIGLASLGASDEDITKLASCYWFSVEFGLCKENHNDVKAYGAGLLSSFGEIEYACKNHSGSELAPTILPWDPNVASVTEYPITEYQPIYFLAESLQNGKTLMRRYCENLSRPFFAQYNSQTETVFIDRPVKRGSGAPLTKSEKMMNVY
jgi:phenylalanine-4-hydroxylase